MTIRRRRQACRRLSHYHLTVIELGTSTAAVTLRELTSRDARLYYELVSANREHLSQHGDYTAKRDATPDTIIGYFSLGSSYTGRGFATAACEAQPADQLLARSGGANYSTGRCTIVGIPVAGPYR
jgi:hypothetical protein